MVLLTTANWKYSLVFSFGMVTEYVKPSASKGTVSPLQVTALNTRSTGVKCSCNASFAITFAL